MSSSFSCLIPFYNEAERVLDVLNVITKIKIFEQIIAIDDGSNDEAGQLIKEKFPQVKLIKLKRNNGKSEAVAAGLKYVKSDYVMLFDADVNNIKPAEIRRALKKITDPNIGLIILNKVDPNPAHMISSKLSVYTRVSCILSGERVLRVSGLKKVLSQKPEGYQLEVAINQYMMDNGKAARWVKSSIKHPYEYSKIGIGLMAKKYTAMAVQMIQSVGLANFMEQLAFFCTEEA